MRILALSCPAKGAAAAVLSDNEVLSAFSAGDAMTGSELLLPMAEDALRSAGMTMGDVDLFAVTAGPGSFTGVRIGVALVKGLAFGRGAVCLGVSTLEALAENVLPLSGLVCPVMDARRGEVYAALFDSHDGKTVRLLPDSALPASELAATVARDYPGRSVMLVGDGVAVAESAFRDVGIEIVPLPDVLLPHSAVSCGRVAYRLAEAGGAVEADLLAPVYLRESQAETTRRFGGK
ncbi:MAG: tRNA (adenosine(37)-N6)-threonylcarbamoyltransferase complex dimerization subunit type 1 TsaB [Clostridia bacterium]|nr:tRNA (adenosine(37)-N6)-threonylcarbamoyltransferase complex dimerization subunit type 1 TsaB [Clostridia bacterium]